MAKRFYFETNGFNGVLFTDGINCVILEDSIQNDFSTFEKAKNADYSGCFDAQGKWAAPEEIACETNHEVVPFDADDFENLIEF